MAMWQSATPGCYHTSAHVSNVHALRRETFPLLMDPVSYSPDTLDIWSNRPEMDYWLSILGEQVDNIVEKAIASEGNSPGKGHPHGPRN